MGLRVKRGRGGAARDKALALGIMIVPASEPSIVQPSLARQSELEVQVEHWHVLARRAGWARTRTVAAQWQLSQVLPEVTTARLVVFE